MRISPETSDHWSVNYEGGKIVDHALGSPQCEGYVNLQIAMDAPFLGKPAEENLRRSAPGMRVETAFTDFDEQVLSKDLSRAVSLVAPRVYDKLLMVQLARGRSAASMEEELVRPILRAIGIKRYVIAHGYRTTTYFDYPKERFILLNIGMFASLNYIIRAGEICIPSYTFDVSASESGLTVGASRSHQDDLLSRRDFKKTNLLGIEDTMPFVTPNNYPDGERQFNELIVEATLIRDAMLA